MRNPYTKKTRDHRLEAEHTGKKGDIIFVDLLSPYIFRGEKVIMTETVEGAVAIRSFIRSSDKRSQIFISDGPRLAKDMFPNNSLACGSVFDTLQPGQSYVIEIEFLEACTWRCAMFGRRAA